MQRENYFWNGSAVIWTLHNDLKVYSPRESIHMY